MKRAILGSEGQLVEGRRGGGEDGRRDGPVRDDGAKNACALTYT